jgi:hypothetical protein
MPSWRGFVALVRDGVTVLGGDGQDPSTEINQAAGRFNELLEIQDFGELKARLAREVTGYGSLRSSVSDRGARRRPRRSWPKWPCSSRSWPECTRKPHSIRSRRSGTGDTSRRRERSSTDIEAAVRCRAVRPRQLQADQRHPRSWDGRQGPAADRAGAEGVDASR